MFITRLQAQKSAASNVLNTTHGTALFVPQIQEKQTANQNRQIRFGTITAQTANSRRLGAIQAGFRQIIPQLTTKRLRPVLLSAQPDISGTTEYAKKLRHRMQAAQDFR